MGETVGNAAKKHIEEVRRVKFSIGGEPNPLKEDLHLAVSRLSAELYTKDIHFLMELIQVSSLFFFSFLSFLFFTVEGGTCNGVTLAGTIGSCY